MQDAPTTSPPAPAAKDDWWCFTCERGFGSQQVNRWHGKSFCPDCGERMAEARAVRNGEVYAVSEEDVSVKPVEDIELNEESQRALQKHAPQVEVVGKGRPLQAHDMLVVRGRFRNAGQEKANIRRLNKAFRKANPNWKGIVLHLPEGMELQQLPAVMVQSLYEALMARFDPELLAQRIQAKKAAQEAAERAQKAGLIATGEDVSKHLEALKKVERAKAQADIVATVQRS